MSFNKQLYRFKRLTGVRGPQAMKERSKQHKMYDDTEELVRYSTYIATNEDEGYNSVEICDTIDHLITFITSIMHHIERKGQCDLLWALLKFHGTLLTTLRNLLFCYTLIVQGVIVVKAHTTYGRYLSTIFDRIVSYLLSKETISFKAKRWSLLLY